MDDVLGLGKATEALVKLIDPLLRPGAEAAGELATDQLKYWRFKRAITLAEKARDILKSKNIEPKAVPLKILAPIINSGSLEEDETLTEKWAGLLASAAAGNTVHPSFPSILEQLSPDEVRILDAMYLRPFDKQYDMRHDNDEICQIIGISAYQYHLFTSNLERLQLITYNFPIGDKLTLSKSPRFTEFGVYFVWICRGPSDAPFPDRI